MLGLNLGNRKAYFALSPSHAEDLLLVLVLFQYPPLGFWQVQHIPKYIRSPWPKTSVMIICCYNCKLNTFIFNGFNILGPLLHLQYSINWYSTKVLFLYASISYESQIQEIRCDNRRGLYFSKLTPDHTNIIIDKEIVCQVLKPRLVSHFHCIFESCV